MRLLIPFMFLSFAALSQTGEVDNRLTERLPLQSQFPVFISDDEAIYKDDNGYQVAKQTVTLKAEGAKTITVDFTKYLTTNEIRGILDQRKDRIEEALKRIENDR